jgi:hypothetical protein
VGDTLGDGLAVGVGVATACTCTESSIHVAFISCATLSYNTHSLTLNSMSLVSHTFPTTSKSMNDKFPTPSTPGAPGTLFTIRTTP